MRIYVGNMNFRTTEESLHGLFSNYGNVQEVAIITDRETGRPRGFAFVTMDDDGGRQAIEALNGQEFEGRTLNINEAQPRQQRGGGGGGGGGGRGGYGGGGSYGGGGGGGGGYSNRRNDNW